MRIVVYEPRLPGGGHYMHHVGLIVQSMAQLDVEVTLLCHRDVTADKSFINYVEPVLSGQVSLSLLVEGAHEGREGVRNFARVLSDYLQTSNADWVLVPTADGILQYLGATRWFGKGRPRNLLGLEALILNGRIGHPDRFAANLKSALSQFLVGCAGADRHLYFDPNAVEVLNRAPWFLGNAEVAPEPIEEVTEKSRVDAREALKLQVPGRLVVSAGRQDMRKGVDVLIDAFTRTAEPLDRLLLIGPHDSKISALLRQQYSQTLESGQIISRDEFASNDDFLNSIYAADIIGIPYRTPFMSSGILHRAISAERMVFTSNQGLLGKLAVSFDLGYVADISSTADCANKLKRCFDDLPSWRPNPRVRQLQLFNTEENFKNTWAAGIAKAVGQTPRPRIKWGMV